MCIKKFAVVVFSSKCPNRIATDFVVSASPRKLRSQSCLSFWSYLQQSGPILLVSYDQAPIQSFGHSNPDLKRSRWHQSKTTDFGQYFRAYRLRFHEILPRRSHHITCTWSKHFHYQTRFDGGGVSAGSLSRVFRVAWSHDGGVSGPVVCVAVSCHR